MKGNLKASSVGSSNLILEVVHTTLVGIVIISGSREFEFDVLPKVKTTFGGPT